MNEMLERIADLVFETHQKVINIESDMKHVATRIDLYEAIDKHRQTDHRRSITPYSRKQIGALVAAIIALSTAVTALAKAFF